MKLTPEEVRHIAKLARLKLSEEEVEKFTTQITDILSWVKMLDEVNVEGVVPTSQVTGLENGMREDKVRTEFAPRDELLACTELPVEAKQIKVKAVL